MIWLLISILTNTLLLLILKGFERVRVSTLQGVVFNYITAGLLGLLLSDVHLPVSELVQQPWAWVPPVLGSIFISVFLLVAYTAQKIGVSVATVANKMSLVIPVIAAVLLYDDELTAAKIIGIVLALVAVVFTSKQQGGAAKGGWQLWVLPAVVFVGSGIIDALINYAQQQLVPPAHALLFSSCCFFTAFTLGGIVLAAQVVRGKEKLSFRNVLGGIVLGVPNLFSIWCIMRALDTGIMDSSTMYPVNNMGIVALSAIGAVLLFKEKLSKLNIAGLALALVAIAVMTFV
ncbi:MAG: EamA/RhaT family transporter [Bacteroidia bacterium]|jgi:drug/metabolite transporter (DMT)-like permease|nr:EamA/RhaT family transporter [Bacteroidia bacterium]